MSHCDYVCVDLVRDDFDPTVMLLVGSVPDALPTAHVALTVDGALALASSLVDAVTDVERGTARVAPRTAPESRFRPGRQRRRAHGPG
jgi:hypothetical protein